MAFTNEQLERYSRHIILKEVGAKGQKKLLNASVLIIGAGGLGAPAAMYLAAAGVGTIGIADADEVDLSNLQRQVIHTTADLGKAKVKSAKETIFQLNLDLIFLKSRKIDIQFIAAVCFTDICFHHVLCMFTIKWILLAPKLIVKREVHPIIIK